jgi:hypothetical protein
MGCARKAHPEVRHKPAIGEMSTNDGEVISISAMEGTSQPMVQPGTVKARIGDLYLWWVKSRAVRFIHRSWFVQLGLMAVVFALLRPLMFKLLKYPEAVYDDWFIGAGLFQRPHMVWVLALFVVMLVFNRRLKLRRGGRWVKAAVILCLLWLWWGIAATGFNYYTNEAYWLDRVLILALVVLAIRIPACAILAVAYSMLFLGQLALSAGDMETTDKLLLLYANFALIGWLLLRTIFPMRGRTLLFFLLALAASAYFAPGWAKLTVSGTLDPFAWMLRDPLHCFMVTAYSHGWLTWLGSERVAGLAATLAVLSPLMAAFTLFVELSSSVMLLFRRSAIVLLVLAIMMHLGIFAMTGIFFWKWMAIDLLLIAWLLQLRPPGSRRAKWRRVAAMAVLIASFPLYTQPKFLGWLDSNVSETYFVEVVTADGETLRVDQKDFGPYDITFEQGAVHYLNREPVIGDLWGNAPWDLGTQMLAIEDPEQMRSLIREGGTIRYDEKKAAELDRFLQQFFTHVNERGDGMQWLDWIGPPHHVQVSSGEPRYDFSKPVKRVQVRFVRTFFDGEHIVTLDDRVVREVVIE